MAPCSSWSSLIRSLLFCSSLCALGILRLQPSEVSHHDTPPLLSHFRNGRGKVLYYDEVFIDEGDMDMIRILRILHRNRYDGVLIPEVTMLVRRVLLFIPSR